MSKIVKDKTHAKDLAIDIYDFENEYISLADIVKNKIDEPNGVIKNWMFGKNVMEYICERDTIKEALFVEVIVIICINILTKVITFY